KPLGMTETAFLQTPDPAAAGEVQYGPMRPGAITGSGQTERDAIRSRVAPTEDREGRWMRGEVHDPRSYALGGVAGPAGLFSTSADLAIFCQMILNGGEYGGVRNLCPFYFQPKIKRGPVPPPPVRRTTR